MGKKDSQEAKEKKTKRKEKMKKFKKRTLKVLMAISIIAVLFGVLLVVLAFTVCRPQNVPGGEDNYTSLIVFAIFGAIFIIVGGKLFFNFKEALQRIGRDKSGYSTKPIQTGESQPSFVYDVQNKYRGERGGNSSVDYYISKVDASVSSVLNKATVTVGIEWSVKYQRQYDYSYMSEVKSKIERDIKALGRSCGENNVSVNFEESKN